MSERKMEGEDSVRTVDCLRGRLLAERAASRDAKAEAEQLQAKLMEVENLLKQEAKSRNRAEKKLKFLMKKLESMNILNASDESEYSGLIDKTDISSISSTASSIIKQQDSNEKQQTRFCEVFETQESKGEANLEQIDSQNSSFSLSDDTGAAEGISISSAFEASLPDFKGLECEMRGDKDAASPRISEQQNEDSTFSEKKMDDEQSECGGYDSSIRSCGDDSDSQAQVDDSMALVVVDSPHTSHRVDPEELDATVRDVLHTLRRAKEQLQSSMVRRRMKMIKVGKTSAIFI